MKRQWSSDPEHLSLHSTLSSNGASGHPTQNTFHSILHCPATAPVVIRPRTPFTPFYTVQLRRQWSSDPEHLSLHSTLSSYGASGHPTQNTFHSILHCPATAPVVIRPRTPFTPFYTVQLRRQWSSDPEHLSLHSTLSSYGASGHPTQNTFHSILHCPATAPVVIRPRTPFTPFYTVQLRTLCAARSLATLSLYDLWSSPAEMPAC